MKGSRACVCDAGWEGASCGRLRLLPAARGGVYPTSRPRHHLPLRHLAAPGYQNLSPVSWGGSILTAPDGKTQHGFFDTGCFMPGAAHVAGYQVVHAVSKHGGPFIFKEVLIPQAQGWSCNPHCSYIKTPEKNGGVYVCFLSIANTRQVLHPQRLNTTCTGSEISDNASSRGAGPPAAAKLIGNCTATREGRIGPNGLASTCAVYTHDLENGPWYSLRQAHYADRVSGKCPKGWYLPLLC